MSQLESDTIRQSVIQITARVSGLSVDAIDPAQPIANFGIDSLMALSVVAAVEKQLKISIPEKKLRTIKSIDDLIALVQKDRSAVVA